MRDKPHNSSSVSGESRFSEKLLKGVVHLWWGIVFCLALALLLVPMAGQLFGDRLRWLEVMTAFETQYLLISGATLLFAILFRRIPTIIIASVALLFHAILVLPWYFDTPQPVSSSRSLKVISFNVLHQNHQFEETLEWVLSEDPDLAVFQEVTNPWPEKLQELRGQLPYHHRVEILQMDVFSKSPIVEPTHQTFGRRRGFIRFQLEGEEALVVYATHTYPQLFFGDEGFRDRNRALTEGLPFDIKSQRGAHVIVVGDLNATMWSPAYQTLIEETGLKSARRGFGVCPTLGRVESWSLLRAVPADHCLISTGIAVHSFRTGPFLGSDHLPVVTELSYPRSEPD